MKYTFLIVLSAILVFSSCGEDDPMNNPTPTEKTLWTGEKITFTKQSGTDPTLEENQDRITDNVWLTRANDGGQIFNIQVELMSDKDDSPSGTAWALGTFDEIDELTFRPFRAAVGSPKDVVGKKLVAHLIADDVYLEFEFLSWAQGQNGGFSYSRSTE